MDAIADRELIPTPFITIFFNHTAVFLAITYGICKNTFGKDLTPRDRIWLMLGQRLPTFLKAMLHDSQVSYMWVILSPRTFKS